MNENENKKQGQLQLELPQEVAQGEYANFAIITQMKADGTLRQLHEKYGLVYGY